MKTLLRSCLALAAGAWLLGAAPAQAQSIPNGNLDTWATRGASDAPTNWLTVDDQVALLLGMPLPFSTNTTTKTTVVHGGTFAAQLQNVNLPGAGILPGQILLGNSLSGGADIPGGLPFTARPTAMQFYYQLSGAQALNDSAYTQVQLTRRVNGATTVIAEGTYLFRTLASTYTAVSVPLQYFSSLAPDSVSIGFSSGSGSTITVGTVLRIDDVSFTGGTGTATRAESLAILSLVPNPSPDGRYRFVATEPELLTAPLAVLDATGRVVRREAARPATERTLDLSDLPSGLYTVQLSTARGVVSRKLTR